MFRALAAATVALVTFSTQAQTTNPIRYTWIATSCDTWNCAAAAMIMANGEHHLMALRTNDSERPWLVLKRVEEGSIALPDDEPFACQHFESFNDALAKYGTLEPCLSPMILTVPGNQSVVLSLKACAEGNGKRRSVR